MGRQNGKASFKCVLRECALALVGSRRQNEEGIMQSRADSEDNVARDILLNVNATSRMPKQNINKKRKKKKLRQPADYLAIGERLLSSEEKQIKII
jgi:hypothetical protein